MWVGILAKLSSLHKPDKRGDGIDPAIEYLSFSVEQKIEGNMSPSGWINGNELPLVEAQKRWTKYFSDLDPWNSWRFLTNKDVVSQSIPLPDILNSLFRQPYAVLALTSKFSSAALVVGQFNFFSLS